MMEGESPSEPSGHVCPTCGGALSERRDGREPAFDGRIGHPFEALELWIAYCTARNAALARKLAVWSRDCGNLAAAARIEEEATLEELFCGQVQRMLEGLEASVPDPA